MPDIIAIGGGQASFSFISKLRSLGYQKPISLICGENHIPYQRPPLSKKFLIGELEKDRLFFKPQGLYCLLYTSPSPRDKRQSRMPSSA